MILEYRALLSKLKRERQRLVEQHAGEIEARRVSADKERARLVAIHQVLIDWCRDRHVLLLFSLSHTD
jgi:hypothetical protein